MTDKPKKFNKRSKIFDLDVYLKLNVLVVPSQYDEPMTLQEIIDWETKGDGWSETVANASIEDFQVLKVVPNLGKPIEEPEEVVAGQTFTLSADEMKILKFLFNNAYDYLNRDIKRAEKQTHQLAWEYRQMYRNCLEKTEMLENKIFNKGDNWVPSID